MSGRGVATGGSVNPAVCAPLPARVWKLTPEQLTRTAAAVVPGGAIATAAIRATLAPVGNGFQNEASQEDMSLPHVEQLLATATDLARQGVAAIDKMTPCLKTRPWSADCVRAVVATVGAKSFRRPLTTAEVDLYVKHYDGEAAQHGPDVGLRQLYRAMFLSPNFLYRMELGDAAASGKVVKLTAHERASALSYLIAGGPPDADLGAAAERNELESPVQIHAQARRLLASPASARGLFAFFAEHLAVDRVQSLEKDPKKFPRWSSQVAADMTAETLAFIEQALWHEGGKLADLLTSPRSMLNERLAGLYGVTGVTGDRLRTVALPAGRVGLLAQGSFLAAVAGPKESDAVRRGRTVRERFLCLRTPEPPPELANVVIPPVPDGRTTSRQRLTRHSADPICAGCHKLIDPLGYALETYDAVGQLRAHDGGQPIDPSGVVEGLAAGSASFKDAAELAAVIAHASEATDCLASRLFAYAYGRRFDEADACALSAVRARFAASGGDVRQLVVDLVSDDAFWTRAR
jgi:hypothetical protein